MIIEPIPKSAAPHKTHSSGARLLNSFHTAKNYILLAVFLIVQIIYFAVSCIQIQQDKTLSQVKAEISWGLPFGRASANVINLLCSILVLPMCRSLLSVLRIPIYQRVHEFTAYSLCFWSIVHVSAHYYNYIMLAIELQTQEKQLMIFQSTGMTGLVMTAILIVIGGSSLPNIRHSNHELFTIVHVLAIPFLIIMCVHGSFCVIKSDPDVPDRCRGGATSWKWLVAPMMIYSVERCYRFWFRTSKVEVLCVIQHPSQVVEVRMKNVALNGYNCQYIYINCAEISWYQWHPFTVTSATHENFTSVHIRVVGDWTRSFSDRLGCSMGKTMLADFVLPKITVKGFLR